MKTTKFIFVNLIICLFSNISYASNSQENIEKATNLIASISSKFKECKNFEIIYLFKVEDQVKATDIEINLQQKQYYKDYAHGKLITDKENPILRYILVIDDIETYYNSYINTKSVYRQSDNEVTITDCDPESEEIKIIAKIKSILINPLEILIPVFYEDKENQVIIEMVPYQEENTEEYNNDDSEDLDEFTIERVFIHIDKKTQNLLALKVVTEDRMEYNYIIQNIRFDVDLHSSYFNFNIKKYENLIINNIKEYENEKY